MLNLVVTIYSMYKRAFLATRMLLPLVAAALFMGCSSPGHLSYENLSTRPSSGTTSEDIASGMDLQIDNLENKDQQETPNRQTAENNSSTNWCYAEQLSDFEFAEEELELLDLINDYRLQENQNLLELSILPEASLVARLHSLDMANSEVEFGHAGFEDRIEVLSQILEFATAAENVGYSQSRFDPVNITLENWLKSTTHRENIEGNFEWTGIGVHSKEWVDADGKTKRDVYITQIFLY